MDTKVCPKCQGEMEIGLMLTQGSVGGVRWSKGGSVGLLKYLPGLPKIKSYACFKCGYIENYLEKEE